VIAMKDKLANAACFIIAAATFAFIGLEATAHHGSTHSGTQPYVRVQPAEDCNK
jgi:hypothetical protein